MDVDLKAASKRLIMAILRSFDVAVFALLPLCYGFTFDPPAGPPLLPPPLMRVLCIVFAVVCIQQAMKFAREAMPQATTCVAACQVVLYAKGLTFVCSYLGVMFFIADKPHLGSPFWLVPFVLATLLTDMHVLHPLFEAEYDRKIYT